MAGGGGAPYATTVVLVDLYNINLCCHPPGLVPLGLVVGPSRRQRRPSDERGPSRSAERTSLSPRARSERHGCTQGLPSLHRFSHTASTRAAARNLRQTHVATARSLPERNDNKYVKTSGGSAWIVSAILSWVSMCHMTKYNNVGGSKLSGRAGWRTRGGSGEICEI